MLYISWKQADEIRQVLFSQMKQQDGIDDVLSKDDVTNGRCVDVSDSNVCSVLEIGTKELALSKTSLWGISGVNLIAIIQQTWHEWQHHQQKVLFHEGDTSDWTKQMARSAMLCDYFPELRRVHYPRIAHEIDAELVSIYKTQEWCSAHMSDHLLEQLDADECLRLAIDRRYDWCVDTNGKSLQEIVADMEDLKSSVLTYEFPFDYSGKTSGNYDLFAKNRRLRNEYLALDDIGKMLYLEKYIAGHTQVIASAYASVLQDEYPSEEELVQMAKNDRWFARIFGDDNAYGELAEEQFKQLFTDSTGFTDDFQK